MTAPRASGVAETLVVAAVLLGGVPQGLHSAQQWHKLSSPHFELLTSAGERRGRELILHLEQIRSFFSTATDMKADSPAPARIVLFGSEREYRPYRLNEFASAYYHGSHDRDYIVMHAAATDSISAAVHEFTHLLVARSGVRLPIWLDEGLAEVYSTLTAVGGKVRVGAIKAGRYRVLMEQRWLDLETLTEVDDDSPRYTQRDKAGIFYALSWGLAHMLAFSDAYRPKYSEFLKAIDSGSSTRAAFQEVYGKSLSEVQKDLQRYIRGTQYKVGVFDVRLEKAAERPQSQAASPLECRIVMAELLAVTGRKDEARQMYESLAPDHPNSRELQEALGYFAWRNGELDVAARHFARAVELGCTNGKLYFDYATLLRQAGEPGSRRVPLLQKAVELKPDFKEARYALGLTLLQEGNYKEAVHHLVQIRQVDRDQAVSFFMTLAHAHHRLGQQEEARKAAQRAREYAQTYAEISSTERLLEFLSGEARAGAEGMRPVEAIQSAAEPSREVEPHLVRKPSEPAPSSSTKPLEPPESIVPAKPQGPVLKGTLQHFDCLGGVARIRILAGGRLVGLAILDSTSVRVKDATGNTSTIDFACGPQKPPRAVVVEYEATKDAKLGTVGVVRSIEFK